MTPTIPDLAHLRRPALLIEAARLGVATYCRERTLRRHLGDLHHPDSEAVLETLLEIEEELNQLRRHDYAGYSPARHVDVVIAILGEVRLMRLAACPDQEKASGIEAFTLESRSFDALVATYVSEGYRRVAMEQYVAKPGQDTAFAYVAVIGREQDRDGLADLLDRLVSGLEYE